MKNIIKFFTSLFNQKEEKAKAELARKEQEEKRKSEVARKEKEEKLKVELAKKEQEEKAKAELAQKQQKEKRKSEVARKEIAEKAKNLENSKESQVQHLNKVLGRGNKEQLNEQLSLTKIKLVNNIDLCFYLLVPYGGDFNDAEKIFNHCNKYFDLTKELDYCDIVIEFACMKNGYYVVAIYGYWDADQGLDLPWSDMPNFIDVYIDKAMVSVRKLEYITNLDYLIEAILVNVLIENDSLSVKNVKKINIPHDDTDLDKNIAKFNNIKIGKQIWMSENLKVDKFSNGDNIPFVNTSRKWLVAVENREPAWCYYDFSSFYNEKFGKLYNWFAVNDPRGLAPLGWHIPNENELILLADFLKGKNVAGKKMKSKNGWDFDNGSNSSTYNGLPGGYMGGDGIFGMMGKWGMWWTSTQDDNGRAVNYQLWDNSNFLFLSSYRFGGGMSVRCVRD